MDAAVLVADLVIGLSGAAREEDAPEAAAEVVQRCLQDRRDELISQLAVCTDVVIWHQTPDLSVFVVPTAPGFSFWPHEHGMWAVTGMIVGAEHNTMYSSPDQS